MNEIIETAKKCGLVGMRPHLDGIYIDALLSFAKSVEEAERKACAKIAENRLLTEASDIEKIAHYTACKNIASGIRARGQA